MPAKFVLSKARTGKFSFSLVATNGKVIANSITYGTKRAALAGIRAVQHSGATAVVDDRTSGEEAKAARAGVRRTTAGTARRTATARKTDAAVSSGSARRNASASAARS